MGSQKFASILTICIDTVFYGLRSVRPRVDLPRVDPPHVRPKRGRSAPNFWDVPPLVLGRSAPFKPPNLNWSRQWWRHAMGHSGRM